MLHYHSETTKSLSNYHQMRQKNESSLEIIYLKRPEVEKVFEATKQCRKKLVCLEGEEEKEEEEREEERGRRRVS